MVPRFRVLQMRKIVNPFPMMVRNERNQPRIQTPVSILAVKGRSKSIRLVQLNFATLTYTKLNFPNPSLSKSCSPIFIPPITDLAAWKPYPIKRHMVSHTWQFIPRGSSCLSIQPTLSSQILKNTEENFFIRLSGANKNMIVFDSCNKNITFTFLLSKLKPASYFTVRTLILTMLFWFSPRALDQLFAS